MLEAHRLHGREADVGATEPLLLRVQRQVLVVRESREDSRADYGP